MDLMQLEMFVATAEAKGPKRAAERVFRTQPAVSMALAKLESEIGAPLFDRANRGAYILTASGELLYAKAKRLLSLRDEALSEIRELHSLEQGRVRIGANESAGVYLLPRLIESYRKKYPKVRIEVTRQNSMQLIHDLREHIVDLALISFAPEEKDVETLPVMNDELILVTSPGHPLTKTAAKKRKVKFADLASEAFIAHTVTSPSRHKVIEAFRSSNTPLNIVMEVAMIETIKKLIAMDLGIGFIPRMCVQEEIRRGELAGVDFEGFQYQRTLSLARRRSESHSHAATAFWKMAFSK